ncbi:permease [Pseudoalteromonas sp. JBTF-M23]|uniref:Permease n=1 Tax=Pseudoalteromonas caenipelagi TaxID=2726988 RepID=A0A849VF14_9GAMM|nr:permease [Pseudoalteromonas caenipelagi]NOU52319.1 permease [Pseudoalteromonas caenipelagi]
MSTSKQWQSAIEFFIGAFIELGVLFVLISFIVSIVNHTLPMSKVRALLSGNKGYGIAMSLGAITPFCSCSTLPMMVGLLKARAAFGPVMAFLFTSPLLNPFIVALFWATFGPSLTFMYAFFVIVMALSSGFLLQYLGFERYIRPELFAEQPNKSPQCNTGSSTSSCTDTRPTCAPTAAHEQPKQSKVSLGVTLFKGALSQLKSMLPYMVLGIAIGAVLHGFVPSELFASLSGVHTVFLIPLCALVGTFLYVRASTMIPIAASLVAKGLSMGAVMSLTIAGAGASLPEMIMLKKLFYWPLLVAFIGLIFITACLTGISIELLNLQP